MQIFADLDLIMKSNYEKRSEPIQNETVQDYQVRLHDLILRLCQEMASDEQEKNMEMILMRSSVRNQCGLAKKFQLSKNGGGSSCRNAMVSE